MEKKLGIGINIKAVMMDENRRRFIKKIRSKKTKDES